MQLFFLRRSALTAFAFLFALGGLGWQLHSTQAQVVIDTIDITATDVSQFPQITAQVNLLDAYDNPISSIQAADLQLTEDEQPITEFNLASVAVGVQASFIFDIGAGITARGSVASSRLQEMYTACREFITASAEKDAIELITVQGNQASVAQSLTLDHNAALNALEQIRTQSSSALSNGNIGLELALKDLQASTNKQQAQVVFYFTQGLQVGTNDSVRLAEFANSFQRPVTIYVVGFGRPDYADRLGVLATTTGTTPIYYNSSTALNAVYNGVRAKGIQYKLTWRSSNVAAGQRIISVAAANSNPPLADTTTITITNAPQPAQLALDVNDANDIIRQADTYDQDVTTIVPNSITIVAEATWPDGKPRGISTATLLVDNQPDGLPQTNITGDRIQFIWDISGFTQTGSANISVKIKDEYGIESTSETAIVTVTVIIPEQESIPELIIPPNPLCGALGNVPNFGQTLSTGCQTLGITPMTLITTLGMIVLGVLLILNRQKVIEVGKSGVTRVTQIIERFTKPVVTGEAKAFLEALDGFEPEQKGKRFEIYGNTPIGRSEEYSELRFQVNLANSPIGRLHCTIHEEDQAGTWSIEDESSVNGTYLNNVRLKPQDRSPLFDGDIIELARVERGGLRFRFVNKVEEDPNAMTQRPTRSANVDPTNAPKAPDDTMNDIV